MPDPVEYINGFTWSLTPLVVGVGCIRYDYRAYDFSALLLCAIYRIRMSPGRRNVVVQWKGSRTEVRPDVR